MSTDDAFPRAAVRIVDGLRIRYAESSGPASRWIVLTSPWPESLHAFRRVWPALAGTARLLAIDLPGFGLSESRPDLLSPRAMGEFVVRLVDAWGIAEPHLVAPDVGTSAALFAAADHPGRFRSLVVGSGATAYPLEVGARLKEIVEAPDVDELRSLDPAAIVDRSMRGLGAAAPGPDVIADYVASNSGGRFAEAARYVRSYPEDFRALRDRIATIAAPVQVIAGRRDPLVPLANAEYLHDRLPNSRLDVVEAGHFVWEEAADQYAALVVAWVNDGHQMRSSQHIE